MQRLGLVSWWCGGLSWGWPSRRRRRSHLRILVGYFQSMQQCILHRLMNGNPFLLPTSLVLTFAFRQYVHDKDNLSPGALLSNVWV